MHTIYDTIIEKLGNKDEARRYLNYGKKKALRKVEKVLKRRKKSSIKSKEVKK